MSVASAVQSVFSLPTTALVAQASGVKAGFLVQVIPAGKYLIQLFPAVTPTGGNTLEQLQVFVSSGAGPETEIYKSSTASTEVAESVIPCLTFFYTSNGEDELTLEVSATTSASTWSVPSTIVECLRLPF